MSVLSRSFCRLSICATVVMLLTTEAVAQNGSSQSAPLLLPTSSASWINSNPLSAELLKGKAAVFYLFEEG